jgi:hypothetical protein
MQGKVTSELQNGFEKQESARSQILKSIAQNGLLPENKSVESGASPQLTSGDTPSNQNLSRYLYGALVYNDNNPNIRIEGDEVAFYHPNIRGKTIRTTLTQINPSAELSIEEQVINHALYEGLSAVFPVLGERQREGLESKIDKDPMEFQRRLQSSIVCITNTSLVGDRIIVQGSEALIKQGIPPEQIICVLAPESIFEEVNKAFRSDGKTIVIPVPLIKHRFSHFDLEVPNYESRIIQLRAVSPSPLFIHGVRLPTLEDVEDAQIS